MARTNDAPALAEDLDAETLVRQLQEATDSTLEPIHPEEALELYLEDKARECRKSTVNSHRSRLGFFIEWCADRELDNLNDISARDLHEYRVWRREGLSVASEKTQMDTLRVFLEWCETIDAVQPGLFKKVKSPVIPDGGNVDDTVIHTDEANEILDHLERYEYATVEHVVWVILAETGMRMGAAHALDVRDYQHDSEQPHLTVRHRPETDTPIKNGQNGERPIAIDPDVCAVLDDYIKHRRPDVTDGHGREPLLASSQGRLSKSTIRTYVYKWSRPCVIGQPCPDDREPDECEAVANLDQASKCPASVTPHPIRRGYITRLLGAGVPIDIVSERCNVSPGVIEEHYDVRSADEKMRQRQDVLRNAL
ncbi:integrase domain-containing protein SAM domain-containing protein [Halovivax asiaticus JCM 14624]|uniref:Integrase domain-containing protein SAM domain-containing protein n=1 Tax=Halovivax asiaticus JCM 14624 TaxID=1227490 RepID=M0BNS5_9EURY|nr:site-specific integrase [Halovivax asiaticus]ELZ12526.1 integrase domain-containing protein SAM domain-containing protein [Halovivax asiaticus JCM 14624]